ncbi:3173_t:CDS:10 [Entrophospora sp. SA101]|nr:3173_t:CDS:10 [Entrophospora sp. SA101]CAJ0904453.1 3422_t:CDS:10 [Entrophospora sp. SA101]
MYKTSFKQAYVSPTDNISKNSIVEDVLEAVYTSKTPTLKPLPHSNSGSDLDDFDNIYQSLDVLMFCNGVLDFNRPSKNNENLNEFNNNAPLNYPKHNEIVNEGQSKHSINPTNIALNDEFSDQISRLCLEFPQEKLGVEEYIEATKLGQCLFSFSPEFNYITASNNNAQQPISPLACNNKCNWGSSPSRWLNVTNFPVYNNNTWEAFHNNYVFIHYYDLRDAIHAQKKLKYVIAPHNYNRLNVNFCSRLKNIELQNDWDWENEGILRIYIIGRANDTEIRNLFVEYGALREEYWFYVEGIRVLQIEYYDVRAAYAAKTVDGKQIQEAILKVDYYDSNSQSWDIASEMMCCQNNNNYNYNYEGDKAIICQASMYSSGNREIPEKNTVDFENIRQEWLNETHRGQYDFVYLRIDFKNKCNVGYAFINFTSVDDKRCELSYANVQGKKALIEKFKSSRVMDEQPEYRPMIFYTKGPFAGFEAPFPRGNLD